ncbi:MAG: DUF5678 domain-containing protein [Bacteroidales bacterium]|nr:DUF5678 domain-containing protein [Bacteroidales bacterium]
MHDFFLLHQEELVEKYGGRYIAIVGEAVVGSYDTLSEAYFKTIENYPLGSFLLQHCIPGKEAYTCTYYSPVFESKE